MNPTYQQKLQAILSLLEHENYIDNDIQRIIDTAYNSIKDLMFHKETKEGQVYIEKPKQEERKPVVFFPSGSYQVISNSVLEKIGIDLKHKQQTTLVDPLTLLPYSLEGREDIICQEGRVQLSVLFESENFFYKSHVYKVVQSNILHAYRDVFTGGDLITVKHSNKRAQQSVFADRFQIFVLFPNSIEPVFGFKMVSKNIKPEIVKYRYVDLDDRGKQYDFDTYEQFIEKLKEVNDKRITLTT